MGILVLNAGSSSLKFALYESDARHRLAGGTIELPRIPGVATLRAEGGSAQNRTREIHSYGDAVGWALQSLAEWGFDRAIRAVGHRVVHGGAEFHQASVIDQQLIASLQRLSRLAPLHNPVAVAAIDAARQLLPEAVHLAVFDTAYFAGLPPRAYRYPVPTEWHTRYGIRRFGFHGISHAYCANRAAEMLGRQGDLELRLVICHLGNGCSATAVRGQRPVTTTMGFTPLEGLMMGTRSGSIDPGILLHLLQHEGFDAAAVKEALNNRSGLLGVSEVSSDYREVEAAAVGGDEKSQLAIDLFGDRVRSAIGSLAVSLGGVDALVFTAGIGENSPSLRQQVCRGLEFIGLDLHQDRNRSARPDGDLASEHSASRILLIGTREDEMIAREAQAWLVRELR